MITGGYDGDSLSSVEIFNPSNPSFSCQLPNMTVARTQHAAVGRTVCGSSGSRNAQTCETLEIGQWQVSHKLKQLRYDHMMWKSPSKGIIVMGGERFDTRKTTEKLEGGYAWRLQHDAGYGDNSNTYQKIMLQ